MRYAGTFALTLGFAAGAAQAVDITLDFNGFPNLSGGQVTGTGIGAIPLPANSTTVTLSGLQANGNYSIDFFHNSGGTGSDFGFSVNAAGTGVASVTTSGHGGGAYQMVSGFTPGATSLLLNANNVTYNVGGRMTGSYWIGGYAPAHATPSGVPLKERDPGRELRRPPLQHRGGERGLGVHRRRQRADVGRDGQLRPRREPDPAHGIRHLFREQRRAAHQDRPLRVPSVGPHLLSGRV